MERRTGQEVGFNLEKFKKFCLKLYLIILSILYTFCVPILLLLLVPLYILRIFVKYYWKFFKHGQMVPARHAIFAIDNPYKVPTANLVVCFTFEGIINLIEWQQDIVEKLIEKRSSSGRLLYPQLHKYLKKSFGYFFWMNSHFNISNHVRLLENSREDLEWNVNEIISLQVEFIKMPFRKCTSPWEFILLQCPTQNKTIMFFRLHHSLSDGFSILQMLMSDMAGQKVKSIKKENKFKWYNFCSIPYEQVKQRYYKDFNVWHNHQRILSKQYHTVQSVFPVDLIKEIKSCHPGSTFSSIILTGISAGIHQYFQQTSGQFKFDHLHTICPIPMPGRPQDKLVNHWSFCFVRLPIYGPTNRQQRLEEVNLNLMNLSRVALVNFILIPLVGALPSPLVRIFGTNVYSTVITSLFPGPPNQLFWHGHRVVDSNFAGGLLYGDQGICFTLISYNGQCRLVLMVDEAVIEFKEDVTKLVDYIVQEINLLNSNHLV